MSYVRESAVAGAFYPGSPHQLKSDVLAFLDGTPAANIPGDLVAFVVPHAGYIYSGHIAAHSYRLLGTRPFDTVVMIGPNHQGLGFQGTSVYAKGAFKTPLGLMEVDEELAEDILSLDSGAVFNPVAHSREHSLEVQVPFLQVVAPKAKIVPIVMADYEWKTCQRLADSIVRSLRKRKGKKVLLVASSDLSHYHSYDEAVRIDRIAIQDIESMDPGRLYIDASRQERAELCGFGPVLATMIAVRKMGANGVKTLAYANSGDVTEEKTRVVGYVSMAIFKEILEGEEVLEEMEEEFLSEEEKKALCDSARNALDVYFRKKGISSALPSSPRFLEKRAVFLTLRKDGKLRGCVGSLTKEKPLLEAVRDLALSAALRDFRFPPVQLEELDHILIEISILTDPVKVSSPASIQIGHHGLLIRKEGHSGLLLPQVALEEGWDRETFLSQTCLKAGLGPEEWRHGAEIFVFRSIKFSETDPILTRGQ